MLPMVARSCLSIADCSTSGKRSFLSLAGFLFISDSDGRFHTRCRDTQVQPLPCQHLPTGNVANR